jgi:hypothetical protein
LLTIFQKKHGHTLRRHGFPVNGRGEYQPWLTYPMIEFLNGLDFASKRIFEFGAGASTLYWAKRAHEVVSVEFDRSWYQSLLSIVPSNVKLFYEPDGRRYAGKVGDGLGKFDVIVIDGAERYRSAEAARSAINPGGMIILDNAEWYPNTADLLSSEGFIEIRMSGFSPINAFASTSSLFLHRDFAFSLTGAARQPPVGGTSIPGGVLDDGVKSGLPAT